MGFRSGERCSLVETLSSALRCGDGPCGMGTGLVVWGRALRCGDGPYGVGTDLVVWGRALWCGTGLVVS